MEHLLKQKRQIKLSKNARERIVLSIVLFFVFLFSYTGIDKLHQLDKFVRGISKIPYAGHIATWVGWAVPLFELFISLLLIVPRYTRLGLQLATILMGIFTLYLGLMLAFAEKRMCHCGGVIESMGWVEHLLFNIICLGLGVWAIHLNKNINSKI